MTSREVEPFSLYGDEMSGNCLKVKWVADYCGLAYDWVDVDVVGHACRTEAFRALNPAGLVPFVRWPDGRILTESNAIMLYLAESAGSNLIPPDPFQRAQMHSWLFWEQYSHEPAIAVRRFQKTYLQRPDEEIDPILLEKGLAALSLMEKQLGYTDWLVGEGLTLADIALVAYTRVAHEGGFDLSSFPSVARWVSQAERALDIPYAKEIA